MMDYDDIVSNAIVELTELAHNRLYESDEEYAHLCHSVAEQSCILKVIEERLTPEEKEQFKHFREIDHEINSRHIVQSYISGAKDCVRILKKLGVL